MDICNTKCKLEKGLNALEFLDTNINSMCKWMTEVEQKLDEIDEMQLLDNLETQIKYIEVRLITIFI